MPLPAPNLDDRRFQDLVDDAKRLVQRHCPEWTDHNVSDPGVTLIETFAYLTDQLLYRLNRVPDRLYLKFLDLIGLRMLPPTPASVPVTFWLAAPAVTPLTIVMATRVGTLRTQTQEAIEFTTAADLLLPPRKLAKVRTTGGTDGPGTADRTPQLIAGSEFPMFGDPPADDDALLLGLDDPAPCCAIRVDFDGRVEGIGVNPEHPPLTWEAWTGQEWTACEVTLDETGGFNRPGVVIVHVPSGHDVSVIDEERAGWLRARVVEPDPGQPRYSRPPMVRRLSACTVGGTVTAVHGEVVPQEELGVSEGVPGQSLPLSRTPVLAAAVAPVVEVSSVEFSAGEGWREWIQVADFADSGPDDPDFVLDACSGLVIFGPAIREPGGTLRQYGAVPTAGATIRIRGYATGGGRAGNVTTGAIRTLKSSIPFVAAVENLHPAQGGVDGETLEEAKARGPLLLRSRGRAVTAEDYEVFARQAAPELARVHCVPARQDEITPGALRVLVVPAAAIEDGRIRFENLVPVASTLARIADVLDKVRLVGVRVSVEPPLYRGITVIARLVARPRVDTERVRVEALRSLYEFLSPLAGGGPDRTGWPFGRPVQAGEIFGLLQQVRGVDIVEDVRLFSADPVTGKRGEQARRVDLTGNSLVFSYDHQIRVEEH